MDLTHKQFDDIEDLFQYRYADYFIEIHQLLCDECYGFALYESGHPFDLGEFIKNHSSAFDNICEEILYQEEIDIDFDSDEY